MYLLLKVSFLQTLITNLTFLLDILITKKGRTLFFSLSVENVNYTIEILFTIMQNVVAKAQVFQSVQKIYFDLNF